MRPLRHLLSTRDLNREWIEEELFPLSDELRDRDVLGEPLKGRTMYSLFYEPSLLTRISFERAIELLGGSEYHTEDASQFFPVGTSAYIENTVQLLASFHFNALVLRSSEANVINRAASSDIVPIINGGSAGDHPTQALVDIYTLQRELGGVDGITIGIVGRLEHRNVNALLTGLALFRKVKIVLVPFSGQANDEIVAYCQRKGIDFRQEIEMSKLGEVDAIYLNATQTPAHAELLKSRKTVDFTIDQKFLDRLKDHCVVLDPMQRTGDFVVESQDRRLAFYRQSENGLYLRMALLMKMLA